MSIVLSFGSSVECQTSAVVEAEFPVCMVIPNRIKIVSVSAGSRHSLLLTSNGIVYSYGWGTLGQLGLGECQNVMTPTKIENLFNIKSISAGGMHSGCVDESSKCYTWGSNGYGQLGTNFDSASAVKFSTKPKLVQYLNPVDAAPSPLLVKSISCGGMHTGAIDLKGALWCWGRADSGQIGYGTRKLFIPNSRILAGTMVPTPYLVRSEIEGRCTSVSCGAFHTLIVNEFGQVYSMGKDNFGTLGVESDVTNCLKSGSDTPTVISTLAGRRIMDASTGGWHSVFLSEDGEVFACGKGEYGRLGLGSEKNHATPTACMSEVEESFNNIASQMRPFNAEKVVKISAGGSHTMVLTEKGTVYCSGRQDNGRCGIIYQETDRVKKFVNCSLRDHLCSTIAIGCHEETSWQDTPEQMVRKGLPIPGVDTSAAVPPPPKPGPLCYDKDISSYTVDDISAGGSHSLVLLNHRENTFKDLLSSDAMPMFLLPGVKSPARGHGSPRRCIKTSDPSKSQGSSSGSPVHCSPVSEDVFTAYESIIPPGAYGINPPAPEPAWDKTSI